MSTTGRRQPDAHGRVWGTGNVYLATTGVIPTPLAANPTLTATALAIRTADHVLDRPGHRAR